MPLIWTVQITALMWLQEGWNWQSGYQCLRECAAPRRWNWRSTPAVSVLEREREAYLQVFHSGFQPRHTLIINDCRFLPRPRYEINHCLFQNTTLDLMMPRICSVRIESMFDGCYRLRLVECCIFILFFWESECINIWWWIESKSRAYYLALKCTALHFAKS